tara:strand:+ start:441 stop:749 length:309 start_codon:yes stop_codon:yes gene_type:complete
MSKIKINKHSAKFVYAEEVVIAKELGGYRDYKLILKARYPDGSKRSVKYPKGYNTYFDSRTPKKRAIIKCVKQENDRQSELRKELYNNSPQRDLFKDIRKVG